MYKIVSGRMCPSLSKLDLALIDMVRVFCVPNVCYIYKESWYLICYIRISFSFKCFDRFV